MCVCEDVIVKDKDNQKTNIGWLLNLDDNKYSNIEERSICPNIIDLQLLIINSA